MTPAPPDQAPRMQESSELACVACTAPDNATSMVHEGAETAPESSPHARATQVRLKNASLEKDCMGFWDYRSAAMEVSRSFLDTSRMGAPCCAERGISAGADYAPFPASWPVPSRQRHRNGVSGFLAT